jgi:MFS family permease
MMPAAVAGTHTRSYRALLALPGARGPVIASALGSMPIGMFGLAILLLARDAGGSFAEAGRVAGALGLANALGAVAQGRLMDRVGQPRVLRTVAAGHALALAGLVLAAERGAPSWALALLAAGGGACLPQVPAAMRSVWTALVDDPERRQTAYALLAVMFEVAVVTAPALVAAIVAVASPGVAVGVGAALAGGSALAFASTRAARGWHGTAHRTGWLGPLSATGMRTLVLSVATMGTAVGIVQVAVPAFAENHGGPAVAGLLLAALSGGSMVGGLVYGARRWPGTPAARLPALLLALAAGCALLAVADAPVPLAVLLLVAGSLLAPVSIVGSTLLDTAAPAGTVTEGFTVMVMGMVMGIALGNAAGGAIVDGASYAAAVGVAGAVVTLGAAFALARRRTLEPHARLR